MVDVNSMGMTACDLNNKLDCSDDIHQGNSVLFTRQLKPLWTIKRFHNSLKAKDSLFNKNLAALILDEKFGLDLSKLFVRLQKILYIYAG